MSDFKLDVTGDLDFSSGDLEIVTADDAIRQQLQIRLRFFLGEWFLNENEGMPYIDNIIGAKNPSVALMTDIFRRAILGVPGIVSLDSIEFDFDASSRTLSVDFSATCDTGITIEFTEFVLWPLASPLVVS